jgi:biotin transport system substrate-specific component
MTVAADQTLFGTLARPDARVLRAGALVAMTLLTAVAAQVSIPLPFTPVPLTLQPMFVLVGGCLLGSRLGASSQIVYLALGIAGMPVFAASPILPQGAARLLGPTGGYLMAYPAAAFVAGWFAEGGFDRRYWTSLVAMAMGLAIIFAGGVLWLSLAVGLETAIRQGLWPFIGADLVKLAFAAAILPTGWRFLRTPS